MHADNNYLNMKKRMTLLLLAGCMMLASAASGQYYYNERYGYRFSEAWGFNLGTQGLGIELKVPTAPRWQFNAGLNVLPVSLYLNNGMGKYKIRSKVQAENYNIHGIFDYALVPEGNGGVWEKFVASAGLAFFFKAGGQLQSRLKDTYHYGEIEVPVEDVGTVDTKISWKNAVAPYFGIGLQQLELNERSFLGFTAGTYYMVSAPKVTMIGTNLLEGNSVNQETLARNVSSYRWWPVLQVNLNFRLN